MERSAGPELARLLPSGYQRVGRVLLVRWPEALRPHYSELAEQFRRELGVATVLRFTGPMAGELRTPQTELLAGTDTITEVREHGLRWQFDAAQVMFAAGNRTERQRIGHLVQSGETVVDLFAGIGYFTIPAARIGQAHRVIAVDRNPVSVWYLQVNASLNGVEDQVEVWAGDNRTLSLPQQSADRVILGYLPTSLPWTGRALSLLRSKGGWLHFHSVVDARDACSVAIRDALHSVTREGGVLLGEVRAREVKPYGPGRTHVVVDVPVRPPAPALRRSCERKD